MQRTRMLEHHAGAKPGDPVRRPARDLDAADAHRAGIGPLNAHDEFQHRGLAGAVRTDQAEDFSSLDAKRHVLDGNEAAEPLGEAGNLEMGGLGHGQPPSLVRVSRPKKPLGNSSITTSAMAKTTKFARSPIGRSASAMAIMNTAPSTAPRMVRRPPSTAAMMICTPTVMSTKVPTEAEPR